MCIKKEKKLKKKENIKNHKVIDSSSFFFLFHEIFKMNNQKAAKYGIESYSEWFTQAFQAKFGPLLQTTAQTFSEFEGRQPNPGFFFFFNL